MLPSRNNSLTRVERITADTRPGALAYLERSPLLNVFLTQMIGGDSAPSFHKNVLVARQGDAVTAVAYCGRQIVIAADSQAVSALAPHVVARGAVRMIIGERRIVAALWPLVAARLGAPRLLRERQLVMSVTRSTLRTLPSGVTVRHAVMNEARAVAQSSASMIAQELKYDPRREIAGFEAGVRQMIERHLWWVGVSEGRLCFFCNVGPWSSHTAQLQGIWTPPELRGRGLASAALGAICNRLLDVFPSISLYVNDFNERAIALYRRVGFEQGGEFTTILF